MDYNQIQTDNYLNQLDRPHVPALPALPFNIEQYVRYDRSDRRYRVLDADGVLCDTFPAGQKQQALRFAYKLLAPNVSALAERIIQKHPQLEARVWRAVLYVTSGRIKPVTVGNVVATVRGNDVYGSYTITVNAGTLQCACDDYGMVIYVNKVGEFVSTCKHILGFQMVKQLERHSNS